MCTHTHPQNKLKTLKGDKNHSFLNWKHVSNFIWKQLLKNTQYINFFEIFSHTYVQENFFPHNYTSQAFVFFF